MSPAADVTLAVEFLKQWKPGGFWVLTAIPVDKKGIETRTFAEDQEGELRKWLDRQYERRWNVYYHVNTTLRRLDKKAEKTDMASMDWFQVDIDPEPGQDFAAEQKRILKLLQGYRGLPRPTVITFSGGGYWAFWKLSEPITIDGREAAWIEAERYNRQIEIELSGDNCHNVDRIARLPGTVNWPDEKKRRKGQEPAMAMVVLENWKAVYTPDDFTQAPHVQDDVNSGGRVEVNVSGNVRRITGELEDELPPGVSSRAKVAIMQGRDEDQPLKGDNSRSAWVLYVCCELVRHDVDDETIYAILTDKTFRISDHVYAQGNAKAVHRYVLRQIQRAKEHVIDPWLEFFNREYSVVESVGGQSRIAREMYSHATGQLEIDFLQKGAFTTAWGNKKVEIPGGTDKNGNPKPPVLIPAPKWWLEHEHRRTYREVIFYPNHDFPSAMNLWRGFAYDAIPGDCSLFLDHVRNVLCRGNEEWHNYLIGWMANAVQNPHEPGQVAVVLRGDQGTGKGTFANHFGALFGTHYKSTSNSDHIMGQFNIMLQDAVVVFADEAFASGNKQHEAALKELITEPRIRVTPKGVDSIQTRNCTHLIMATNSTWAVAADLKDRRFFVLEMDTVKRVDTAHFARMQEQMDNGGYQALLHFLLTYDLSTFNVRACPKTDELRHQQEQSLSAMEAFWLDCLLEGRLLPFHRGWTGRVYKDQFVDIYADESGDRNPSRKIKMSMGRWLSKIASTTDHRHRGKTITWKNSRGRDVTTADPIFWQFPSLSECRRLWDAEFGAREWPEIEAIEPDENPEETDAF